MWGGSLRAPMFCIQAPFPSLQNPQLLSGLADGSVVEFLIHEQPDREQPVQLRRDLGQETSILGCQEQAHGSNHSETDGSGEPSGRLFIQYEPLGIQFQTQTDDLMFACANGSAHRAWLARLCQRLDHEPAGQRRYCWLHLPGDRRRDENKRMKLMQ